MNATKHYADLIMECENGSDNIRVSRLYERRFLSMASCLYMYCNLRRPGWYDL